jgi:hypothetical protein
MSAPDPPARGFVAVACAVALATGAAVALAPGVNVPCDFAAFWSSAVLMAHGQNPYDPVLLLPLERAAGWPLEYAITIFNPPWALPPLLPLAALPVQRAFGAWFGLQVALLLFAGRWLWLASGGRAARAAVSAVLVGAFVPALVLVTGGQLTAVPLFGFAGFAHFRARRPVLAGCLGALTAVKPHLFVLFALALALDALRCAAGRRAALAGTAVLLGACAAALFVRPEILDDYRTVLLARGTDSHRALGDYAAPVAGVMLRAAVPGKPTVIQFVPCLLAALAFVCAVRKVPPAEHWGAPLPFALAASLVVAPYGGWWYDMVLLLPLVLLVAARTERAPGARRAAVVAFAALYAALVVLYARRADLAPLFALVPPCAAAVAVVLLRAARRHEVPA